MKKKIVMILLTLLIATTVYAKWFKPNPPQPVEQRATVQRVIDHKAVIRSLDQRGELVGMEGKLNKSLEYKDSDFFGSARYVLSAEISFKMGYDLDLVKRYMRIEGNTIYITSLPAKVISFEMPYDEVNVDKKVKWFHKTLKAEDIQMLYKVLKEEAQFEIIKDERINDQAKKLTQTTLRNFLMQIPNVEQVIFIEVGTHNG